MAISRCPMKNGQLKWLLGLTASALLSTSITFGNRWTGATGEENDYGAVDPTVPENRVGPPQPNLTPPVALDGAITANVLVNSRELCPNGHGLQQNETALPVAGNTISVTCTAAR